MTRSIISMLSVLACVFAGCASAPTANPVSDTAATTSTPSTNAGATQRTGDTPIRLGNFSVSLAVKDIAASRAFYEKLGFHARGGNQSQNWLVMQNDTATIGLFQGMFEKNMLTFNPGWDRSAKTLPDFEDVRQIQQALKKHGLTLTMSADEATSGPASVMLIDPDGNPILIDQHVPSPTAPRK